MSPCFQATACLALLGAFCAGPRAWALDPFEPNDSCASAAPLRLPFNSSDADLASGDVDYYTFDGLTGDLFSGGANFLDGRMLPLVGLFDPDGRAVPLELIGRSFSASLPADGRYCVAVGCPEDTGLDGGPDAACSGGYFLALDLIRLQADMFEPNETRAAASPIAVPFQATGLTIFPAGDLDHYRFQAPGGTDLNISVLFGRIPFEPRVTVFDAAGTQLATGGSQVSLPIRADTELIVLVEAAVAGTTGDYGLSIEARPPPIDPFEPNDGCGSAAEILPPFGGEAFLQAGDVDAFALDATAGEVLMVGVFPQSQPVRLVVAGPSGILTDSSSFFSGPIPESGRYCVVVACPEDRDLDGGPDATCSTQYFFFVDLFRLSEDRLEPNGTLQEASPVSSPFFDFLTIFPAGDVDLFRFDGAAGDQVLAFASPGRIFFQPLLRILDASGTEIARSSFFLQASLPSDGTYFLSVSAEAPAQSGEYSLSFQVISLPSDPFEPNDEPATATPIAPAPTTSLSASLRLGDLDFYRLEAEAGSELRVSALSFSGPFTPRLGLFDTTGRLLTTDVFFLSAELAQAGTYFVAVTSGGDSAFRGAIEQFGYSLNVELLGPPRVLEPGHALELAVPGFAGAGIAVDRESGAVYSLWRSTDWQLIRFADGRNESVFAAPIPGAGFYPYISTDLEIHTGFGSALLLFSADDRGQTIVFDPASGSARVFAPTSGSIEAGLASSEIGLLVSSGVFSLPAIQLVDASGGVSTFLGADRLSSSPSTLARSPDGSTLYYAAPSGDIVHVDVATAAETARTPVGTFGPFGAPNFTVDPATGDLYAVVGGTRNGGDRIVRVSRGSPQPRLFAENLREANDIAPGPCDGRESRDWCLWVTTRQGTLRIRGFQRPFDIPDPQGDAPPAIDIAGVEVRYVDPALTGSSTHLDIAIHVATEPSGSFHALIDYGETPELGADVSLSVDLTDATPRWSGLDGLAERSYVRGREVHFLAPIEALRRRATDEQKQAAATHVRLWVASEGASGDRAPDEGFLRFRSFYPRTMLAPLEVDFGGVEVGRRGVRTIAIANAGIGVLPVTNFQVSGLGLSLLGPVPPSIAEGASTRLEIACNPFRASLFEGKFHVRSTAPVGDRQASLRCAGFVSPGPLSFPDPAGDARGFFSGMGDVPDLLRVTYELQSDKAIVTQEYDREVAVNEIGPAPRGGGVVVVGAIEFDLDRNGSTGACFGCGFGAGYGVGAERQLFFFGVSNGTVPLDDGRTAAVSASGNALRFEIPADWLGGGSCLALATIVGTIFEPTDAEPGEGALPVEFGCTGPARRGGKPLLRPGAGRWKRPDSEGPYGRSGG